LRHGPVVVICPSRRAFALVPGSFIQRSHPQVCALCVRSG